MRAATLATTVVALGAFEWSNASIVPTLDNRVVHAQGSVVPAQGDSLFQFEIEGAQGYAPWNDAASVMFKLPDAAFSGQSSQDSQVLPAQLIATGMTVLDLSAGPGALSSGNSCSHFVLAFDVIGDMTVSMSGWLLASDAESGAADAYALALLTDLATGEDVIDQITPGGVLALGAQATLSPGSYEIRVESHAIGTANGPASGFASASFNLNMTFAETCPDLDGDGSVGISDFLALLGAWGPNDCFPTAGCPDLDGDGSVGITDFLGLLSHWGACP